MCVCVFFHVCCMSISQHSAAYPCLSVSTSRSPFEVLRPHSQAQKHILPSWKKTLALPSPKPAQSVRSFSYSHTVSSAPTEECQVQEGCTQKSRVFISQAFVSGFSLKHGHIPACRCVVTPVSWLWLHFSGAQTHLAFLFATALSVPLAKWPIGPFRFPVCESLLSWQRTKGKTSVGCILFQPAAFHIQEKKKRKKKVLETDGVDDCIIVWIYLISQNCTLKNGKNDKFYVLSIFYHTLKKMKKNQWVRSIS